MNFERAFAVAHKFMQVLLGPPSLLFHDLFAFTFLINCPAITQPRAQFNGAEPPAAGTSTLHVDRTSCATYACI